jgi:hypothetical protein
MLDYSNRAIENLFVKGVWKDIHNCKGIYQINSLGFVRRTSSLRVLNMPLNSNGYKQVNLSVAGKKKRFLVHRLVAIHFIINPHPKTYVTVNHRDGNKTNNNASNLEWCSQSLNNYHKTRVLKKNIGENHCRAKLSETNVLKIRLDTRSCSEIAKEFNVKSSAIVKIKSNKTWRHI